MAKNMESILPVYYQIKNTIQNWILNKEYKSGEKIPSENQLAKMFSVNRLTVRRALALLIQEGLLKTRRGEGTFVTDDEGRINSFDLEFSGFMDDLFYQVSQSKTKTVEIISVTPPELVAEKLELEDKGQSVVLIKRVRLLHGRPFAYTVNYLPEKLGSQISENALYDRPLLQIMEQDLGVIFEEAFQTIEATFCDSIIAEKLEIPGGLPMLFVERIMYSKGKKPVELVQSSYRGDTYKYVVRLKRPKNKEGNVWIHKGD